MTASNGHRRNGRTLATTITDLGYSMDEVRSALQKSIRRGLEEEAAWWAYQLLRHDWHAYLWRTLRIIASEDVGTGDTSVAATIDALARNAKEGTDGFKKTMFIGMCEMHAVIVLCRARKSWEQNHLLATCQKHWLEVEDGRRELPPVPEFALDAHTDRGRRAGVPKSKWWDEGDALHPKAESHYENGGDPFAAIHGDEELI